jgi:hypothetical protein
MSNVVLFVMDTSQVWHVIDLKENEVIALNYNYKNITSLKPEATYSQDFRIPSTLNNCSVFGVQHDVNHVSTNTSGTNVRRKFLAYITVDSLPILEGYVQFISSIINNGNVAEFTIRFFGESADLMASLGDKTLKDLEYPLHYFNNEAIIAANNALDSSYYGTDDFTDERVKFCLIEKGQKLKLVTDNAQGVAINQVVGLPYTEAHYNARNCITFKDFTPCFRTSYLLNVINTSLLSSTGIKKINVSTQVLKEMERLHVPFTDADSNIVLKNSSNDVLGDVAFNVGLYHPGVLPGVPVLPSFVTGPVLNGVQYYEADYLFLGTPYVYQINFDTDSGFDALTGIYTIPRTGGYTFYSDVQFKTDVLLTAPIRIWYKVRRPSTSTDYWYSFIDESNANAGEYTGLYPDDNNTYPYGYPYCWLKNVLCSDNNAYGNGIVSNYGDEKLLLFQGDEVSIHIMSSVDPYTVASVIKQEGISFRIQSFEQNTADSFYDLNKMAPPYRIADMLGDIMKMTNAIATIDKTRPDIVTIITMDEYLSSGVTLDWTRKMETAKDIQITPTTEFQSRKQIFSWNSGNDIGSQAYKTYAKRNFGYLELFDTESDFTVGETTVQLIASSTPAIAMDDNGTIAIAKFIDKDFKYVPPGPRLVYVSSIQSNEITVKYMFETGMTGYPAALDGYVQYDGGGNVTSVFGKPFNAYTCSNYETVPPDITSLDANFGQEVPIHAVINTPYQTLFQRYYQNYLQELYSPESKIMECSIMLDIADVYNLQFNDSIYIWNSYWRILSVSNYVLGGATPCRVKLIRKLTNVEIADPCVWLPVAVETNGFVIMQNSIDLSTGPGTEECCTKYGYIWTLGKCRTNKVTTKPNAGNSGTKPIMSQISSVIKPPGITKPPLTNGVAVSGTSVTVGTNTDNSIVHGKDITLTDDTKSTAVFGENITVENKGLWYGGGGTDPNSVAWGIMSMQVKDTVLTPTQNFYGEIIKVPNNTRLAIKITVAIEEVVAGVPTGTSITYQGLATTYCDASGNTTSTYPATTIADINTGLGTWIFGIKDPGLNQCQFCAEYSSGGPTLPFDVSMSVSLEITQLSL